MSLHPGVSFASPETNNSSSTVSSPNTLNNTNRSSKIHMSDMKIGPAAVAAAIADSSPSAQLLKMSEIPMLRQSRQRGSSPEELVEKDPLAAAMWRLYRSSATFLPESVRMENMTWRMMAMTLKRKEAQKYIIPLKMVVDGRGKDVNSMQVDQTTPSETAVSPPFQRPSSAVPIRPFAQPPSETSVGIASTVPYVPAASSTARKEFGYVQKRLRKTSMDVAAMVRPSKIISNDRDENDRLNSLLVFLL
jgi:GATA-binding protein, other eukaryote